MKDKVLGTIEKYNMLRHGSRVIAAVSGGADSITLLYILTTLRHPLSLDLSAVHVNHNLRGDEALRDQHFVEKTCKDWNIPLNVYSADIPAVSANTKESIEQCARRVRYEFLNEAAGKNGIIATAHTLSDAIETLFFNITRGSGLKGLCSIPPVRDNIIRPLIDVTRDEIENFILKNNLEYVVDSTNLKDDYTRNNIRHNIIPKLYDINPSLDKAMKGLIDSAAECNNFIESLANEAICNNYTLYDLSKLHNTVKAAYISARCNAELGITLQRVHIDAVKEIILNQKGSCQLPNGCFAKAENNKLLFLPPKQETEKFLINFSLGELNTPYNKYRTYILSRDEYEKSKKVNKLLFKNTLDYGIITNNTILRSREDGDKIKLFGKNHTKRLKKLFNEAKIPLTYRDKISVLCTGNNILWVDGFGVSESSAVNDKTETVLIIEKLT